VKRRARRTLVALVIVAFALALGAGARADDTNKKKNQPYKGPKDMTVEDMLKRYDRDHDGRISKDEYIHEEFDKIDRNHDGFIDAQDFPQGGKDNAQLKRLLTLDKNKDGRVSYEEYADGPILDRFKSLDKDGSGYLERPEIEAIVKKLAADARKRLAEFIDRYDLNHDGKVTREEFPGSDAVFARLDRNKDGVVDDRDAPNADEPLVPAAPPPDPPRPPLPAEKKVADAK
jgi:Ca2+-binding EF-hand superfamily protein